MRIPALILSLFCLVAAVGEVQPPERWKDTIERFVRWDRKNSFPSDATLFVGSSSIVRWDSHLAFPQRPVINRGFGGCYLSDVTHYFDQVVAPYKPRCIVLYGGDNDVAAGMSAERIAGDFRIFVERCRKQLPGTRIVFVAIKPSLARWEMWDTMKRANALIEAECNKSNDLRYADIATPMLGPDGKPKGELLAEDKLHLSPGGYAVWNRILRAHLP